MSVQLIVVRFFSLFRVYVCIRSIFECVNKAVCVEFSISLGHESSFMVVINLGFLLYLALNCSSPLKVILLYTRVIL